MTHRHRQYNPAGECRAGFTLVEIIVVVAIILVLASLTVIFLPSFEQRERSYAGASQLQQWLLTSKNRALLERTPTGVRLFANYVWVNDVNGNPVYKWYTNATSAQYIQMPEDFTGGTVQSPLVDVNDPTKGYQLDQLVLIPS